MNSERRLIKEHWSTHHGNLAHRECPRCRAEVPAGFFDETGTRWTEEGQGATWAAIADELDANGYHAEADRIGLPDDGTPTERGARRTNLALTGQPLTAEDIIRIGKAK